MNDARPTPPSLAWAARLASGERIAEPVALVVAHADDETLWAGSALHRFDRLRLIHLTDSAPRDMADAHRLGFATREAYAAARAAELGRALTALDAKPERVAIGLADQEAVFALPTLIDRLAALLEGVAAVITHPYEGGHPDHDTAAIAVARATARLARPPAQVEFACYHQADGARRFGAFWPDPAAHDQVRPLDAADRARADAALAAHATQAAVIDGWRPEAERWRAAPAYRFDQPPPPGASLYDGFGWTITSTRWREAAASAGALLAA